MKKRIFYFDDSSAALKRLSKVMGNTVLIDYHKNAKEALDALDKIQDIGLFLIASNNAKNDSLDFVRKIRKHKEYKECAIILYTTSFTNHLAYKATHLGCNDCISKMSDPKFIRQAVLKQIVHPSFVKYEREYDEIHTASYTINDNYYQFCPGLGILVSAQSEKAAESEMYQLIKSQMTINQECQAFSQFPIQSCIHKITRISLIE